MSDLATRLRTGTQPAHTAAENTAFMKCFLKGIVEWEPFRKLIADLYWVYSTLETELRRHLDQPAIAAMYFPELNRSEKLEEDLAYFYGEDWANTIVATPAGKRYVERLQAVSAANPVLLIAHAYVRYMGDLSGGQGLRHIARSALDLPPDRGTGLHEFDQLPTVEAKRAFKLRYRDQLNSLPLSQDQIAALVDEANRAFALNRDVFHELEPAVKAAVGDHVFDLITRQDRPGSTEQSSGQPSVDLVATE